MTASNAFTDPSQGEPADVGRGNVYQQLPKSGCWNVFISHTSEFTEYPVEESYIRRVVEWVETTNHKPKYMKLFPAVPEPGSSYDVEVVRECHVYVGIHGMRWGSPLPDVPEMSHVEQEYETAKRIGIPRLLFLLDENSSEHCLPEEKPMDAMYAERQKAFRQRLTTEDGNIYKLFSSPDDLKAKVKDALLELEKRSGYCKWSWPKPWDFSGYRESKRKDFVGREWLFNEVRRWVNGDDNPSSGTQALLIGADYGVGKSAFLAELIVNHTKDIPVAAHYFCQADLEKTLNPAVFVCSIAWQLKEALPAYRQAIEAESAKDLREWLDETNQSRDPKSAGDTFDQAVLAPLMTIPSPPKPMLLVVDALDESLDLRSVNTNVDSPTIVELLATFANRMPPWLKLLATSRPRNDVLEKLGQAFTLKPLNPISNIEDLEHYCKNRCDREPLKAKIEAAGLSTSSVATFLSRQEQSGGKFLYVSLVLSDLESRESYNLQLNHPEDLNNLPRDLAGFYGKFFRRRFPTDESYALSRSILGILCEIREPIGMNELTAILKRSEQEIGTSLKILQDLLRLQPVAQVAGGGSMNELLYSFGHVSLMQWLDEKDEHRTHRADRFAVNRSEANKQLMEWAMLEADNNHAHASEYLVRHLESHIPIDRIQSLLINLLTCFRWLEAKARITGISSLLRDYERLERPTAETSKLEQILRQSFHILNNNGEDWNGSRQLASQLLARINAQWASPFWEQFRATCQDWLRSYQLPRPLWPSLQSDDSLIQTYSFPGSVKSIFSCFKDLVAVGYGEESISIDILDIRSLSITSRPIRLNTIVTAISASPDGRLVLGCEDGKVYSCAESEEQSSDYMPVAPKFDLSIPIKELRCVGKKGLVIKAKDGSLHYYDLNSKTHVELQDKIQWVTAFTVLRDGHIIVANKFGEVYRILPFISSTCLIEKDGKPPTVTSILELADDRLAFGCFDGSIKVFNPETTIPATQTGITAHKECVTTMCMLGIDKLISGSSDGMIRIWDLASMRCIQFLDGHSAGSGISCLLPLNESTILSGGSDRTLKVWRVQTDSTKEKKILGHGLISSAAAIDNNSIVYTTARPSIHLSALDSVQCFSTVQPQRTCSLAIFSKEHIVAGSDNGRIQIWSMTSQELKFCFEFQAHSDQIQALAVLPGKLVSGSDDTKIRIWRISSDGADCIHTLHGHNEWIRSLLVLADGRLASASDDRTTPIRIWDPEGGNQTVCIAGISGPVRAFAALPNGLAIASNDSFLAIYDLPNLEMQAECIPSAAEPPVFELKSRRRCDFRAFSGLKISSLIYIEKYKLLCGSAGRIIFTYCPDNIASHPSIAFVSDHEISTLVHVPMTSTIIAGDKSGRLHWIDLST